MFLWQLYRRKKFSAYNRSSTLSVVCFYFFFTWASMAGAASQAGDADSSRAPGLTSGLQGPWMFTVVLYCWCHSDSASVLLYFTFTYPCLILIQAYMKSYVLLHTAVGSYFFLSNLYLNQGIGSAYVIAYFICKGDLELSGTQVERELQNEKFLAISTFSTRGC